MKEILKRIERVVKWWWKSGDIILKEWWYNSKRVAKDEELNKEENHQWSIDFMNANSIGRTASASSGVLIKHDDNAKLQKYKYR